MNRNQISVEEIFSESGLRDFIQDYCDSGDEVVDLVDGFEAGHKRLQRIWNRED